MSAVFSFDDDDLGRPDPGGVLGVEDELHMLTVSNGRARFLSRNEASDEDDLDDVPELVNGREQLGVPPSARTESRLGSSYEVGIDNNYISSFAGQAGKSEKKMTPEEFEPLKILGEGTYGKVFLVKQKSTGRLFAQKQLKKASMVVEKKKIEQTKTERAILESVRHPYIVRLFYALQDSQKLYLILEYAQGGELFTHLAMERMLSEEVTAFYAAEIVLALCHLHTNVGVVYRDLKPENCLLDAQGHLVLTDFGLSKVADDGEACRTFLGTPEYMAPEVLEGKEYGYAVDWWSLGAVCHDLMTGSPPFRGNNHAKIIEKIKKTKKLNLPYYLSADAKDFLIRLLRKDPNKRLGHNDIATIKNHRFFRKIDWKALESRSPDVVPPIVPVITDPELAENFSSSFTSRPLTPEDEGSIPIPKNTDVDTSQVFKGFSFTASQSFIELADHHLN
ncbi:hypothetical protein TRICI_006450 [Trichomonascus ciferrii]|uniref:Protein kinase domain-containing protein n=1 Tax=Trichomonascus ciferrii TaxID=44093 RepID=A0A642UL79_9ASCO|nr:hypothetical protein TRICI_006450 [Trichomonascus ciferrii]